MKVVPCFRTQEKGQSIVEFSMMLPVFLLIVMFSIEICFGTYYRIVLNQLLINAARVVAVSENETSTQLNNKIQAILASYQNQGAIKFSTTDTSLFTLSWTKQTVNVIYKTVTVKAKYTGVRLPFVGTLTILDQLVFPYVDPIMVLP
jgi:Flp pilus assembly protein TadG